MIQTLWPVFGLRIHTQRVELRLPSDDDIVEICELVGRGIHDTRFMPFGFGWTDVESPQLERNTAQHYWKARGEWSPESWSCNFAVVVDGSIVGAQEVSARMFAQLREVETGSWLGLAHQGQGIGTEMRAAALHFAFAGLGALFANSAAFADNEPSRGVSRKMGYVENGETRQVRRGEPSRLIKLRLSRETWELTRRDDIEITGLDECRDMFGAAAGTPSA